MKRAYLVKQRMKQRQASFRKRRIVPVHEIRLTFTVFGFRMYLKH